MKIIKQAFGPLKKGTIRVIVKDEKGNQTVMEDKHRKEPIFKLSEREAEAAGMIGIMLSKITKNKKKAAYVLRIAFHHYQIRLDK